LLHTKVVVLNSLLLHFCFSLFSESTKATAPHETEGQSKSTDSNSTSILDQPTPSLLLAGLLGGCAVTASAVFLTFFMCIRRKLLFSTSSSSSSVITAYPGSKFYEAQANLNGGTSSSTSPSNNSSPACLLRNNNGNNTDSSQNAKWGNSQHKSGTKFSRPTSRNSYVTIASFWNDIFSGNSSNHRVSKLSTATSGNGAPGSITTAEVSPYAYAHIVVPPPVPRLSSNPPPTQPPPFIPGSAGGSYGNTGGSNMSPHFLVSSTGNISHNKSSSSNAPQPPPLIEWYSQSPSNHGNHAHGGGGSHSNQHGSVPGHHYSVSSNVSVGENSSCGSIVGPSGGSNHGGHIYSNHLYTFNPHGPPNSSPLMMMMLGSKKDSKEDQGSASECGSIVQVDGFQMKRSFAGEKNVVERFL